MPFILQISELTLGFIASCIAGKQTSLQDIRSEVDEDWQQYRYAVKGFVKAWADALEKDFDCVKQ